MFVIHGGKELSQSRIDREVCIKIGLLWASDRAVHNSSVALHRLRSEVSFSQWDKTGQIGTFFQLTLTQLYVVRSDSRPAIHPSVLYHSDTNAPNVG